MNLQRVSIFTYLDLIFLLTKPKSGLECVLDSGYQSSDHLMIRYCFQTKYRANPGVYKVSEGKICGAEVP